MDEEHVALENMSESLTVQIDKEEKRMKDLQKTIENLTLSCKDSEQYLGLEDGSCPHGEDESECGSCLRLKEYNENRKQKQFKVKTERKPKSLLKAKLPKRCNCFAGEEEKKDVGEIVCTCGKGRNFKTVERKLTGTKLPPIASTK